MAIEKHEPYIAFQTGKCPVCKKRLENFPRVVSGHLLYENGGDNISVGLGACEEHKREADDMAEMTEECKARKGCHGVWDFRFGLMLSLSFPNSEKEVRLI